MSFPVEERRVRKREWLGVALVAILCLTLFNAIQRSQSARSEKLVSDLQGSSSVVAAPKDATLHISTAEKLWSDFLEPDGRADRYRDNPVRVTGRIAGVYPMRRVIELETGGNGIIECNFNAVESMEGLQRGRQITVEGLLKGNTDDGIFVQNVVVVASP